MMNQKEPVYICSPLSATTKEEMLRNMHAARAYAREVSGELNCRAIAPHAWLPELLDDKSPDERELAMKFDMELLRKCGTIIICHPAVTKGVAAEMDEAQELGIPIFVRPAPGKYHPARRIPEIGEAADWRAWGL